jgi:hypothetical protein
LLLIILVVGIVVTLSSPSFMVRTAQAISDLDKNNDDDNKKSFEKDGNNSYNSKDNNIIFTR